MSLFVPDPDRTSDNAIMVPELRSFLVMWETCAGGQSRENFLIATTEEWNWENEEFYGWIIKENDWFTPVRGTFDGALYLIKADREKMIQAVGAERYPVMHKLMEGIKATLEAQEQIERMEYAKKFKESPQCEICGDWMDTPEECFKLDDGSDVCRECYEYIKAHPEG